MQIAQEDKSAVALLVAQSMSQSVQAVRRLAASLSHHFAAVRWRGLLLCKVELNRDQQVQQVCNSPMEKSVAVLGGAEPAGSASGVLADSMTAMPVCSSPTEEFAVVLGGAEPAGSASVPIRSAAQMRPDR